MNTTYSAKQVAQLLGIAESRIRYWAQTGFVGPTDAKNGRAAYSFADVVAVKAAKELLDGGVSLQNARKNLEALRSLLPSIDRPLAELRVLSDGEEIVVRADGTTFVPLTGQIVMDFRTRSLASELGATPVASIARMVEPDDEHHAYVALLEGLDLEARGDDEGAIAAYERALTADPTLGVAQTNLGNIRHRKGDSAGALIHYRAALASDPAQPEARFNLGNVLHELDRNEEAVTEWYRVVADCPEFAAAHFNLAAVFSSEGAYSPARAHLYRFLALEPKGEWAAVATRALQKLS